MAKETKEATAEKTPVQPVELPEVSEQSVAPSSGQVDLLLDIDVEVTVALGTVEMPVKKLLQLGPGAVLELGKSIDAPADLYLQGTKFAEGDVVVVDDCFAIKINSVVGLDAPGGDAPAP